MRRKPGVEKQFVALVAHDMRTPLAVIAGVAGTLRDHWGELPERERLEHVDAIIRNAAKLRELVEHDLEGALADTQGIFFALRPFDLGAEVRRIVDDFAASSGNLFRVTVADGLPLVWGDTRRNWQALTNLLSNAVKFSPDGAVVDVGVTQRAGMAEVAVRDYSIGIDNDELDKLFRKFSRLPGTATRETRGAGLGLYLAKRMVEAQGGTIRVASRRGEGSTFTYTLPLATTTG
jgi:signal transduction histidine kinase